MRSVMMVPIGNIRNAVAAYYGVPLEHFMVQTRKRRIARPRQIAMALAREQGATLHRIANYFGLGDHTTVMHACWKVRQLSRDPDFARELEEVRRRVNEQPKWNIEFAGRHAACKAIGEFCRGLQDDLWWIQ